MWRSVVTVNTPALLVEVVTVEHLLELDGLAQAARISLGLEGDNAEGYEKVKEVLEEAFANVLWSKEKWKKRKAELVAGQKWAEVIY